MHDELPARAARQTLITLLLSALLAVLALLASAPARADALEVGIADQKAAVWSDSRIQALHLGYARLIVPWDAVTSEPATVQAWLDATAAQGMAPHVAFEHRLTDHCPYSSCTPPTAAQYRAAVSAFIARWPQVRTYTVWNEVNHQSQPVATRPDLVAQYYQQLTAACPGCTVVAGDVLDSGNYTGWLRSFLGNFPAGGQPQLWGIHNYGDVGRGTSSGTDAVLATVPGTLWVEETGGLVSLRGGLSGGGSTSAAETQAAAAIDQAFTIAKARPRIGRMYIYQVKAWANDTFDSGLFRPDGTTRPSYTALVRNLGTLGQATPAATTVAVPVAAPTGTVRWSAASGRLVVKVACAAGVPSCAGSVRVTVRTKGARAKQWAVKVVATRAYAATSSAAADRGATTTGSATVRLKLTGALRRRMRRAGKRQAVARISQVSPGAASTTARRSLPKP